MSLAEKLKSHSQESSGSDQPPHLIVSALAGTGKTTTLIEGLKAAVYGQPSKITPSDQQLAVWDELAKSRDSKTQAFVAFNKSIATELQRRVPAGVTAMTMHSMGNRAVSAGLPGVRVPRNTDPEWVVRDRIARILDQDIKKLMRDDWTLVEATRKLVSLCKMNLLGDITGRGYGETEYSIEPNELAELAAYHDIDLNSSADRIFQLVPKVLDACRNPKGTDGKMDFDDQIWLPIVLNLPITRFDLLLVDEAQDLNRCQQELAKRAGRRLGFVGDSHQAIYAFAGADAESMARLERELVASPEGCIILPLTVTRRCGKAIVAEAQKIVPGFEAHPDNCLGLINRMRLKGKANIGNPAECNYTSHVIDGDMLLCRVNAPLVSQCLRFIKQGRRAEIQGKKIGAGLISTVNKMKASNVLDLIEKLDNWLHLETEKENRRRTPSESKLIALQDRHDCISVFLEGREKVEDVITAIQSVFTTGKRCPKCDKAATNDDQLECWNCKVALVPSKGIRLSSIHKAKGLEAHRVFLLEPEGATVPHPMAKTPQAIEQEMNLRYVAITRAIEELVYVS